MGTQLFFIYPWTLVLLCGVLSSLAIYLDGHPSILSSMSDRPTRVIGTSYAGRLARYCRVHSASRTPDMLRRQFTSEAVVSTETDLSGIGQTFHESRTVPLVTPGGLPDLATAWLLFIADAADAAQLFPLNHSAPNVIGRDGRCSNIVLRDRRVSRRHAQVLCENGHFVIDDLGSTYGTYVNNRRVANHRLKRGDVLQLGDTKLVFVELQSPRGHASDTAGPDWRQS